MLPGTAAAANTTKVAVTCAPDSLSPGAAATCVATVTDTGSAETRQPPSGTVTYTLENGSTGTFEPDASCDLEPSGAFSSKCTVSYTPATINGGEHDLLATYGGDPAHGRATTRLALEVTPANDETDTATRISLPAKLTGTTEGATWGDDPELCGDAWAPVWYSLRPAEKARLAVRLTVKGRVDSVIAVFRLDRSKFTSLGCNLTDASGVAGLSFDVQSGGYVSGRGLRAVGRADRAASCSRPRRCPRPALRGRCCGDDARLSLDPLLRPGAAFTLRLKQGETIKLNAVPSRRSCIEVAILRPGARSETDVLKASEGCDGYLVYTPDVDGWASYPLVVRFADASSGKPTATAEESRTSSWSATDLQIHMRRADPDDLAPGILLHDQKVTRGALAAGIADAVDVYRFRLTRDARRDGTGAGDLADRPPAPQPDRRHDRLRVRGCDQFDGREAARPRHLLRGRPRPPRRDRSLRTSPCACEGRRPSRSGGPAPERATGRPRPRSRRPPVGASCSSCSGSTRSAAGTSRDR